jgi:hypothetical protein
MNLSAAQRARGITNMKAGDSVTGPMLPRQSPNVTVLSVIVEAYTPNPLNSRSPGKWRKHSKARKELRDATVNAFVAGRKPLPVLPVSVQVCRLGPRKLDRWDGLPASLKPIVDGVADAYRLKDDDTRLEWLTPIQEKAKKYSIRITITATEGRQQHGK